MLYKKAQLTKKFLEETYEHFENEKAGKPAYKTFGLKNDIRLILDHKLPVFINHKSTEFGLKKITIINKTYLAVVICGSNDWVDWVLLNPDLRTWPVRDNKAKKWRWIKWSGVLEAKRVMKVLRKIDTNNLPVLLCVHSKSGATAPGMHIMLRNAGIMLDKTFNFEPATSLSKSYYIENMVMFLDPDDPVPNLGKPVLTHPKCMRVYHPGGKSGKDHSLSNWDKFIENKVIQEL
jgi:hypothetical protein